MSDRPSVIRCAAYARYSSDMQRPESIADQIRHCRQEAARQGWVILDEHIYSDEAISGVSVEGRAGLLRLTRAALQRPRPFDLIVVDDTSRLARDVVDAVQQFRELRFHGIDLYFVNQGLHSGRENAEFLVSIYGAMDSEYIRELGRKTHRGLEGQALRGFSAGGIVYGYRREGVYEPAALDRDGQPRRIGVRWVIEPAQAQIVRRIFRLYADGTGGYAAIAAALNAEGVASPRQTKGHRERKDGIGAGWDASCVRAILLNEIYRGRLVWNRSRWRRDPRTRRRQRRARPDSEWVVLERSELRIIDEDLWLAVEARRARVRSRFEDSPHFGKAKTEYGKFLLSGLLVCGTCGGLLSIRTGSSGRGDQRYGCSRRWRRGASACGNNLHVRRDLVERRVLDLLRKKLYQPAAVLRLAEKVNDRIRAHRPERKAERSRLLEQQREIRIRLERLRRFIEAGDLSAKVRDWLAEAERDDARIDAGLALLDAQDCAPTLQVHPAKAEGYLRDLHATLAKGGTRARELLRLDVERIVIHPIRSETAKPFARAEIMTTGKGLLDRVALVVAGAGFEPATFGL